MVIALTFVLGLALGVQDAGHAQLGLDYLGHGNPTEASREFRKSLELRPNDAETRYHLGIALGQLGSLPEALVEFRHAVQIDPNFGPAHQGIGIVLRRQGKIAAALIEFKETVRLMPQNPVALYDLGTAQKETGDLDGAITHLRRAVELQPDFEKAKYALGIALKQRGQTGEAATEMRSVREFHESRLRTAQIKSLILDAQSQQTAGNSENAISDYAKVVELDPDDLDVRILLGNALAAAQQTTKAAQAYDDLIQRAPNFAEAYNNRGLLALQTGNAPQAKADFERAIKIKPAYGPAHYNLGLALEKMGNSAGAESEFKTARALCAKSGQQTCPQ